MARGHVPAAAAPAAAAPARQRGYPASGFGPNAYGGGFAAAAPSTSSSSSSSSSSGVGGGAAAAPYPCAMGNPHDLASFNIMTTVGEPFVSQNRNTVNAEYQTSFETPLSDLRAANWSVTHDTYALMNRLASLPYGYAMDLRVEGASIREIRDMIVRAGLAPNEYAISGWGYDCVIGRADVFACVRKEFRNLNLVEIEFPAEDTQNLDGYNYLAWMRNYRQQKNESDMRSWILFGDVSICRIATYPTFALLSYRTAGFDRFIPFPSTFSIVDEETHREYTIYIPGGQENCLHAAIKWGIQSDILRKMERIAIAEHHHEDVTSRHETAAPMILDRYHPLGDSEEEVQEVKAAVQQNVTEFFDRFIASFKEEYVQGRLRNSAGRIRAHGREKATSMIKAEYEKIVKSGYSSTLMKRLFTLLRDKHSTCVRMCSFSRTGEVQKMWHDFEPPAGAISSGARQLGEYHYVSILRVGLDGSIVTTGTSQVADLDNSMLAHAIAVSPPPPVRGAALTALMKRIQDHVRGRFEQYRRLSSDVDFSVDEVGSCLETLVQCQNMRMQDMLQAAREKRARAEQISRHMSSFSSSLAQEQRRELEQVVASTLMSLSTILNSSSSSSSSSSSPSPSPSLSQQEQQQVVYYRKTVYVIAFDIETVENIRGVQRPDIVYEPFLLAPPAIPDGESDPNIYTIPQAQIPYTVQWAYVDMREEAISPYIQGPAAGGKVTIEYGSDLLGKCVTDFMDNVRDSILCKTRGEGKVKVFAYAHNASGFDAYIMKYYNHKYPVKKVLLTGRGILSISFDLGTGIELLIRDTKVFFAATLKDLCTIFKVPPQYCKTDFPITAINAKNFKDPQVKAAVREYMENDVYSLAIIVHNMSNIIHRLVAGGDDPGCLVGRTPPPPSQPGEAPAITRYVTLMSLVKMAQARHFSKKLKIPSPLPTDIAALRKWICFGNVGGRVTPYWRGYASARLGEILALASPKKLLLASSSSFSSPAIERALYERLSQQEKERHAAEKKAKLRDIHKDLLEKGHCMRVLDVTSLYPHVMAAFPMPCLAEEPLEYLDAERCEATIAAMHCGLCEDMWSPCYLHCKGGECDRVSLGLVFVIVSELAPPPQESHWRRRSTATPPPTAAPPPTTTPTPPPPPPPPSSSAIVSHLHLTVPPANLQPRKLLGGGLVYSYETDAALSAGGVKPKEAPPPVQCYTHYDLYWLSRQGFTYKILAGIKYRTSYEGYSEYTQHFFDMRMEAKKVEKEENLPKSLSTFVKLFVNGGYGVNAQRDITTSMIVTDVTDEGELRSRGTLQPDEIIRREAAYTHRMANGQWLLRLEKSPYSCEYFADQSPNHIGACVVATARHYVNLALFRMLEPGGDGGGCCSYTDTDSLCAYMSYLRQHMPFSIYDERSDAPMGTYKNDHESGPEEIVICSFILRKKVKLHITLDAEGELRFYPTFTGFNPNPLTAANSPFAAALLAGAATSTLPISAVEYERVKALCTIFFEGSLPSCTQTEFKRTLDGGVVIDSESKISGDYSAFWEHSAGSVLYRMGGQEAAAGASKDFVEKLIPRGVDLPHPTTPGGGGAGGDEEVRVCSYLDWKYKEDTSTERTFSEETRYTREVFWRRALGTPSEYEDALSYMLSFIQDYYEAKISGDVAKLTAESVAAHPGAVEENARLMTLLSKDEFKITPQDRQWCA